ncbi:hypothetical protein AKJ16_DCAP06553 [Drosera capensis]
MAAQSNAIPLPPLLLLFLILRLLLVPLLCLFHVPYHSYAKAFPDVSKIKVFDGNNFKRWQERVFSVLDVHEVAFALIKDKLSDEKLRDRWKTQIKFSFIRSRSIYPNNWYQSNVEDEIEIEELDETLFRRDNIVPTAEWNLLDRQALWVVRLTLAKNVAYNIVSEKTTYGLIQALSNMYEKSSASNKFPDSWSGTVTTVASTSGTMKLTFNGIRDLILNEDIRSRNSGETTGSLLSTDSRGRKSEKRQSSERGRSKSKKRGQSKPRKDITC